MNFKTLLQAYRKSEKLADICQTLQKKENQKLQLKGLYGSQKAFFLYALYLKTERPLLVLANDKEEAAYLQSDLQHISEREEILFFPDSFRRPQGFDKLDRASVLQRTEAVSKLLDASSIPPFMVSYPEAIFEQVVAPEQLAENAIKIKVGEDLDRKFLVEILTEYGFNYVDFVYEPGQYALRGGIIDIFSYGHELPYRLELFDEEVESIRSFDPSSQLSTKKMAFVTIVPNVNTQFKKEQKTDLFSILPKELLICAENVQLLLDRLQDCFEKAQLLSAQLQEQEQYERIEEIGLLDEQAFVFPRHIMDQLANKRLVEFANTPYYKKSPSFRFQGSLQPRFGKNFERLIEQLRENSQQGITNCILAENPKQIERFYSIFEDLRAHVKWHPIQKIVHKGFVDQELKIACYTDHEIFERFHKYKTKRGFDRNMALKMKAINELQPGDYVTHIDHGVGKFAGLQNIELNGKQQESVKLVYDGGDILYVSIQSLHKISKYVGKDGKRPSVHKLGSNAWANTKKKTKKKIKALAFDLIKLYAKRKSTQGIQFPPDGYLQNELEASFIYEDTPDQAKATEAVKEDMMKPYPMDRLICGDVGFGKTEIAVRAAFKAVVAGKQVAILVPTTILALQHAQTFRKRLGEFDVQVEYINRFRTTKEKKEIYERLKANKIDILIGTHAILNKKVQFADLGLLIIDEEQKFGVASKEKLRNIKVNVDTLTLTATPIPRTLQFSLMAARDLSVINTPPPNRQPIHTELRTFNAELIQEAIEQEVSRGGQVFFIHNRVKSLEDMAAMLHQMMPNLDVAVAHGQMEPAQLEKRLMNFIQGYNEVLVCTNIIETGLDIANANTIIINNAHHFGLSDLHQLRGRVGRSNKKAYCYLLAPPLSVLSSDSRKRLQTLEQFAELGSGIHIAMRDLDIRGAGNILGGEQSGFIVNMGYETYQKILNETIQELKQGEYKELFKEEMEKKREFVQDVIIELDEEMLIPSDYVPIISERLALYQKMDELNNEADIKSFSEKMIDRFGPLPEQVSQLFEALRLRWIARSLGFERLHFKGKKLRCYFISKQDSPFYESDYFLRILDYIQKHSDHRFFLKQSPKHLILICEGLRNLHAAKSVLKELAEAVD